MLDEAVRVIRELLSGRLVCHPGAALQGARRRGCTRCRTSRRLSTYRVSARRPAGWPPAIGDGYMCVQPDAGPSSGCTGSQAAVTGPCKAA